MTKKFLIASAMVLVCAQSAHADTPIFSTQTNVYVPPVQVAPVPVGLKNVTKRGFFHHNYVYQLSDGTAFTSSKILPGYKDLRTYQEAHPKRYWVQQFCGRWQNVLSFGVTAGAIYPIIFSLMK